jgi:hypothetical protein
MPPRALLAIRSDIAPDIDAEYLDWLTREHTIERVGIEGFVSARIFRCEREDIRRYLILYELENAAVVDSPAYLERLNNPTPWTTRMMPHLGNFVRGGGEMIRTVGTGYGAAIVPLMIQSESFPLNWRRLEDVSQAARIVAIRMLRADAGRTAAPTQERSLRTGDRSFNSLLLIEALDRTALVYAVKKLYPALLGAVRQTEEDDYVYSSVFSLTRDGLPVPLP